ncbi:hypothetical protein RJ639_035420 [Escallonia herrerae]|uniref:Uncharacterized protein n=1 Tax=Escallonia herrerae TaxID=1293975 RepID=A0AA88WTB7_9ASTE|nr:hypothetical protein RJ639_035420 [Escallonia herrerae]
MYPLAGRWLQNDRSSIKCNDQGVEFIETSIKEDMFTLPRHPKIDLFSQLVPCIPVESKDEVILAIQVNIFGYGGTSVGVFLNHVIADASTSATFSLPKIYQVTYGPLKDCGAKPVTKRFVFDASNIAALRAKGTADATECPTRVEAVVVWIWAAVIAAARERNKKLKSHLMSSAVNLRKRMIPSLPFNSIGNIFHVTTTKWIATSEAVDYNLLTCRVRESVRSVTDKYVRKMHENGEYVDFFKKGIESLGSSNGETEWLTTSSWCKFPLYEADFGWWKPTWVATCVSFLNSVTLIDTGDGEGIEAWVGLTEEDMDKLDHNSEFLSYVSSSIAA